MKVTDSAALDTPTLATRSLTFCGEQRHPATAVSSSLTLLDEDGNCREEYWENYGLALSKENLKKKEKL